MMDGKKKGETSEEKKYIGGTAATLAAFVARHGWYRGDIKHGRFPGDRRMRVSDSKTEGERTRNNKCVTLYSRVRSDAQIKEGLWDDF